MSRLNINNITIAGTVGGVEIKHTNNGGTIFKYSVAWNPGRKDKDGEWLPSTWFNVTSYASKESTADFFKDIIVKGANLYVEGRMEEDKYTDKEGNKRSYWGIFANTVKQVSPPSGEGSGGGSRRSSREEYDAPWEEDDEKPARTPASAPKAKASNPWDEDD